MFLRDQHPLHPFVLGKYTFTMANLGVIVFFIVSGYLVTGSWLSAPSLRVFAEKRARRLYPGLGLTTLIAALILGPLVTSASGYFLKPAMWAYVVRNLLIFPYDYRLPGVFAHNPHHEVNGVLWTLGLEVLAYIVLALVARYLSVQNLRYVVGLAALCYVGSWPILVEHVAGGRFDSAAIHGQLLACFFTGAAIRIARRPITVPVALLACAALVALHFSGSWATIIAFPALAVVIIFAGTRQLAWTSVITRLGDPSYGMYIYTFMVQQLLIRAGYGAWPNWRFVVVSEVAGLAAGYLSWHLLEKRVVAGKRKPASVPVSSRHRRSERHRPSHNAGYRPFHKLQREVSRADTCRVRNRRRWNPRRAHLRRRARGDHLSAAPPSRTSASDSLARMITGASRLLERQRLDRT